MSDYVGERSPLRTFGLRSLRRRWKFIVTCGALFFLAGLLIAVLRPASYKASTQLLVYVKELQPGHDLIIAHGRADLAQVQNEIEIIQSRGVLAKVVRSLNLADDREFVPVASPLRALTDWVFRGRKATLEEERIKQDMAVESLAKHISVSRVGTSHTILVNVTTSDAYKSKRIASAISQAILEARTSAEQDGARSLLRQRLQGLGPNAYVITPAVVPDRPSGPRKIIIILGVTFVGLLIGSALVLLQDFNNRTIRTAAQVEYLGLECIGAIPLLRRWTSADANPATGGHELTGDDEFRPSPMLDQTVRRTIVAIKAANVRTIGVTSAVAGEGAAMVAKSLAGAAACGQRKVLLVKANRNEPSQVSMVEGAGLPGDAERSQSRSRIVLDERTGLDVLEADSAAWWMQSDKNRLDAYDFIVLSLPPLEHGGEFGMAAKNLDGILLVLKWGGVELERVQRAMAVSGVAPSEFVGAVLNMVDERAIGKFGDKFWEAEATVVAKRRPFEPSMSAGRVTG